MDDFLLFLMHQSPGPGGRRHGLIQSHLGKGVAPAVPSSHLNKISTSAIFSPDIFLMWLPSVRALSAWPMYSWTLVCPSWLSFSAVDSSYLKPEKQSKKTAASARRVPSREASRTDPTRRGSLSHHISTLCLDLEHQSP